MKIIQFSFLSVTLALGVIGLPGRSALAQMPGSPPGGVDTTLTKLISKVTAFSAKAEVRVVDSDQNELVTTPMTFAKLGDKVRVEVDLAQIRGRNVTPADAARMRKIGMDRVVSITRFDKKQMYIIYPGMQSYVSMALSNEDVEAAAKPQFEAAALGTETVDGHPCVKNKVVVTDSIGQKRAVLVWNATDLKEFPIRIQTSENGTTVVMSFSGIQFAKPDARQFDPPAGFTKFADLQQMMEARVKKPKETGAGR